MKQNRDIGANRPLISFILTCRNLSADTIRECIGSITALSLRPHEREIIVVDDGSDECTVDKLTDCRDHILYIRQKDSGLNVARNTGIRMSTGKYLQFIACYDRLMAEAYEQCLDIVRYDNPDIVMFKSSDKEGSVSSFQTPEPTDGAGHILCNDLDTAAGKYIFSRKILMDTRFTPGMSHGDDEFTPLLMLHAEKVYATDITALLHGEDPALDTVARDKKQIIRSLNDTEHIIFRLNELASSIPHREQLALKRYVTQLTTDYIRNIIRFTRSSKFLDERLEKLKARGLFPLPVRSYSAHYSIFRRLANNKITRSLMSALLR